MLTTANKLLHLRSCADRDPQILLDPATAPVTYINLLLFQLFK